MRKQFRNRIAEVTAEKLAQPERWMYLSFADEKFNGVVVIMAHGIVDAISKTHRLGINPGGQVMCVDMPEYVIAQVPEDCRTRLLSDKDVRRIWPDAKTIREHERERASSKPEGRKK